VYPWTSRFSVISTRWKYTSPPETKRKLKDLAAQTGRRAASELVQSVLEGYFDELSRDHEMLNSRNDNLTSGRVKTVPRRRACRLVPPKKRRRATFSAGFMTGYDFHPEARLDLDEIWQSFTRIISTSPT
jgi:predicted DNA-binding protein